MLLAPLLCGARRSEGAPCSRRWGVQGAEKSGTTAAMAARQHHPTGSPVGAAVPATTSGLSLENAHLHTASTVGPPVTRSRPPPPIAGGPSRRQHGPVRAFVPGSSVFLSFVLLLVRPRAPGSCRSRSSAPTEPRSTRHLPSSHCPWCPPSPSSPPTPFSQTPSLPPPTFYCPATSTRLASITPLFQRGLPSLACERHLPCRCSLPPPPPSSCLWAFRHKRVLVQHPDAVGRGDGHD